MPNLTSRRFISFASRASTALALIAAPYQLNLHAVAKIGPAAAYAKGEGSGGGGGGEGHGGGSGGSSGSGGNSGPGGGGDDGGNSGSGDHDNGAGDNHDADDDGHDGHEHVNATTGDKVEVDGNKVEVTHPDGTKEEVENGKFEIKDATGRTIVERPATPADIARLQGA